VLATGESHSFKIYYGGAFSKVEASAALAIVDAEVYSYGYPNIGGSCDTDGSPNTFIFGFVGVGGTAIFTALPTAIPTAVPTPVPTAVPTSNPTEVPTDVATAEPTAVPTSIPTAVTTDVPTAEPTPEAVIPAVPTATPTSAPTNRPASVISNGLIKLGVNPEGHLNIRDAGISSIGSSTTAVGLRLIFSDGSESEATAPGCLCEGWGVSASLVASGTTVSAGAVIDSGGVRNMLTSLFVSDASTAVSTVVVPPTDSVLKVTHDYHPSSTLNLYEVVVTITNIGTGDLTNLRYRRVMVRRCMCIIMIRFYDNSF
jgi:hypothetical protein